MTRSTSPSFVSLPRHSLTYFSTRRLFDLVFDLPQFVCLQLNQHAWTRHTRPDQAMPSKIQTYLIAVPRDPTSAEIAYFLSTRSGDQMMQLVQSIREPAAQATLTASLLALPPTVSTKSAPSEKARKALNAFVGFRCKFHSHFRPTKLMKFRLLHPHSRLQAMAYEEAVQPYGHYVGSRPQQVPVVPDDESLVCYP